MPIGGGRDKELEKTALGRLVLTTSQQTLYTTPSTNRANLRTMSIAVDDYGGDDDDDDLTKVDIWLVDAGQSVQTLYRVWWDVKFTGSGSFVEAFPYLLQPGDYIVAKASRSNRVVLRLDGEQIGL